MTRVSFLLVLTAACGSSLPAPVSTDGAYTARADKKPNDPDTTFVAFDVVGTHASVARVTHQTRIDSFAFGVDTASEHESRSNTTEPLCSSTPCLVAMRRGHVLVELTPIEGGSYAPFLTDVRVGPTTTSVVARLDERHAASQGGITAAVLFYGVGVATVIGGGIALGVGIPDSINDEKKMQAGIAGGVLLGAGFALIALGALFHLVSAESIVPGASVQR